MFRFKKKVAFTKGPDTGDPPPFTPKTSGTADVSHVIKEIFQDYLSQEVPSCETAKTLQKTCRENTELKDYADSVMKSYDDRNAVIQEINQIEKTMMKDRAKFLVKKDKIHKDKLVEDIMARQMQPIYGTIDKDLSTKYSLIRPDDIFPDDSAGDDNLNNILEKFLTSSQTSVPLDVLTKLKPPPEPEVKKPRTRTKTGPVIKQKPKLLMPPRKSKFKPKPQRIIFSSCRVGFVYEKMTQVTNVGSKAGILKILPLKPGSKFQIYWEEMTSGANIISAGLSVTIHVVFSCTSLQPEQDVILIKVEGSDNITIPILAMNDPPVLISINQNGKAEKEDKCTKHTSLECGFLFTGDTSEQLVHLCNVGGEGRFWLMEEEEWATTDPDNFKWDTMLISPPYAITPVFFHLKTNEKVSLQISFHPLTVGFQTKQIVILCDSSSVLTLDLMGDAVFFESKFIRFQDDLKKNFPIDMEDDKRANFCLNIGKMLHGGRVKKSFVLFNRSHIKLKFKWSKRMAETAIQPHGMRGAIQHLHLEQLKIYPKEGEFPPNTKLLFQVVYSAENMKPGLHRGIISLHVENIPWMSIREDSKVKEVKHESEDTVSVLVNEIEIWVESITKCLNIQPGIMKLTGSECRINEKLVLPPIAILNTWKEAISFEWLEPSFNLCAPDTIYSVVIEPFEGTVEDKSFVPCLPCISPISPGLLLHQLRCSINQGAFSYDLMVCAKVSSPQFHPSTYLLNFGTVCRGVHKKLQLQIISDSNCEGIWLAREFKYDFCTGALERLNHCKLSVDCGYLPGEGTACYVEYTLCTETAEMWISIIELGSASGLQRERQHFILVVADIVVPKVNILAPPGLSALLGISDTLFLGVPTDATIQLCNTSHIPARFKWGTPVGKDEKRLEVKMQPQSGLIKPVCSEEITVTINPKEKGRIRDLYVPCFLENGQDPVILGIECKVRGIRVTFLLPTEAFNESDEHPTMNIPWSSKDIQICPEEEEFTDNVSETELQETDSIISHMKTDYLEGSVKSHGIPEETVVAKVSYDDAPQENLEVKSKKNLLHIDGKEVRLSLSHNNRATLFYPIENCDSEHYSSSEDSDDNTRRASRESSTGFEILDDGEAPHFHTFPLANEGPEPHCEDSVERLQESEQYGEGRAEEENQLYPESKLSSVQTKGTYGSEWGENWDEWGEEEYSGRQLTVKPKHTIRPLVELKLNLKTKELVKKTFAIKNETPITSTFKIIVKNFPTKKQAGIQEVIDIAISEIHNQPKKDPWEILIRKGAGLLIYVSPSIGEIKPFEIVPVYVQIYSNTWGIYKDTLAFTVGDLPPFLVNLKIEVKGLPVSFPYLPTLTPGIPTLSFGNVKYKSECQAHNVIIKNESGIPLSIAWHIYLTDKRNEESNQKMPYNLILDLINRQENCCSEEECDKIDGGIFLEFLPYYGKEDYTYFDVYPDQSNLKAHSTSLIELSFSPHECSSFYALLVGIIRESPQVCDTCHAHYRRTGFSLRPIFVALSALVEIPILTFQTDRDELEFNINGGHIFKSANSTLKITKTFVVKNKFGVSITASVSTEEPFQINGVETMAHRHKIMKNKDKKEILFTVLPGECAEIYVSCSVSEGYLQKLKSSFWEIVKANCAERQWKAFTGQRTIIESPLHIKEQHLSKETVHLKLIVDFPLINISLEKLQFGVVLVGDRPWEVIELSNFSTSKILYKIKKVFQNPAFTIIPSSGEVPPAPKYGRSMAFIKVIFAPRQSGLYKDEIIIETNAPSQDMTIPVTGVASLDAKFHTLGEIPINTFNVLS